MRFPKLVHACWSHYVLWRTVNHKGVDYTIQVKINTDRLIREILESIDANPDAMGLEVITGNTIIRITRQS